MVVTIGICIAVVVFMIVGIRHYWKSLTSGCCGVDSEAAPRKIKVQDRDLSHYPYEKALEIRGMTCSNCVTHVQNALNSLNGVYAKVDLSSRRAVIYMKDEVPDPILRHAVSDAGYAVGSIAPVQTASVG